MLGFTFVEPSTRLQVRSVASTIANVSQLDLPVRVNFFCGKPLYPFDVTHNYTHPDMWAAVIGAIATSQEFADLGTYAEEWTYQCPDGPGAPPIGTGPHHDLGEVNLEAMWQVFNYDGTIEGVHPGTGGSLPNLVCPHLQVL